MFNQLSIMAFNTNRLLGVTLACMHESAERLYQAAKILKKIEGQSNVARVLGESPQTVKNWEKRGVSADGAISAERAIGCRASWIKSGAGDMRHADAAATNPQGAQPTGSTPLFEGAQTKGWLAQSLSEAEPMMEPPTISWGSIIDTVLPSEFKVVIGDDSMAKEFPKGCTIVFSTTEGKPRAGDAVLVADGDNNVFFREYQERRPGHWQAVALNTIYQPLDSRADGLRVLAIKVGSWGRRG